MDIKRRLELLVSENERKNQEINSKNAINWELRDHLQSLERDLNQILSEKTFTSESFAKSNSLVQEIHLLNEDFAKIELKLLKTKGKFADEHSNTIIDKWRQMKSGSQKDRSSVVIRRNIFSLIEELNNLAEKSLSSNSDQQNENSRLNSEIENLKLENHSSVAQLNAAKHDCFALENNLSEKKNELAILEEKLEDLQSENADLRFENQENVVARELAKRLEQFEEYIEELKNEKEISEIKVCRLRRLIQDEKFLYYVENFAKTQSEIHLLEKRQLKLEFSLSKTQIHFDCRNEELLLRVFLKDTRTRKSQGEH